MIIYRPIGEGVLGVSRRGAYIGEGAYVSPGEGAYVSLGEEAYVSLG